MKCKKKYNDGGIFGKPSKKKQRKNVAPQNPRFLPSAQMEGEGSLEKKEKKEKKRKLKLVKRKGRVCMTTGGGRKLGRSVDASCKKPGS
jgi:hypothetical protein